MKEIIRANCRNKQAWVSVAGISQNRGKYGKEINSASGILVVFLKYRHNCELRESYVSTSDRTIGAGNQLLT